MRILVLAVVMLFGTLCSVVALESAAKKDPDALPDLRIARGSKDIAEAWFIGPTTRYQHYVLGSAYEASGLRVKIRDGAILTLLLDQNHVFEDRQPRLADLDGDGKDEIVVVMSALSKGASLAAFAVNNGRIKLKAQTPYIGRAFRWLNPAGIADFDGDGTLDVAFVAMPHLVKRLEFWSLVGGNFKRWGAFPGYSNHRNGSMHTDMSIVADFDANGVADLALPNADRRKVELITLKNKRLTTLSSIELNAPADGQMTVKNGHIVVHLATGERQTIKP